MSKNLKQFLLKRIHQIEFDSFYQRNWSAKERYRVIDELYFIFKMFYDEK